MSKIDPTRPAEEVMRELARDPEFVRRQAAKEEKRRRLDEYYTKLAAPLLDQLSRRGFAAPSLEDVVERYAPLPGSAVEVLLSNLASCEDRRQCEELVHAIAAAKNRFDGRALVDCYERIRDDEAVRWVILNTIALTRPHSIDGWLEKAKHDPYLRKTLLKLGYSW